jgi:hypothetical protein
MIEPRGSRVRELVQHDRRFRRRGVAAEQPPRDELVHVDVGLMQPPAADVGDSESDRSDLRLEVVGGHGTDLLEHLATILVEEVLRPERIGILGTGHVAEIRADVVRIERDGAAAEHGVAVRRAAGVGALQHHCRRNVAEDEVAVTVAVVHLRGGQFGVDHQHAA